MALLLGFEGVIRNERYSKLQERGEDGGHDGEKQEKRRGGGGGGVAVGGSLDRVGQASVLNDGAVETREIRADDEVVLVVELIGGEADLGGEGREDVAINGSGASGVDDGIGVLSGGDVEAGRDGGATTELEVDARDLSLEVDGRLGRHEVDGLVVGSGAEGTEVVTNLLQLGLFGVVLGEIDSDGLRIGIGILGGDGLSVGVLVGSVSVTIGGGALLAAHSSGNEHGYAVSEHPSLEGRMAIIVGEVSREDAGRLSGRDAEVLGLAAVSRVGKEAVSPTDGLMEHLGRARTTTAPHLVAPPGLVLISRNELDAIQHGAQFATAIGSVPSRPPTARGRLASHIASRSGGRDARRQHRRDVDGHANRNRRNGGRCNWHWGRCHGYWSRCNRDGGRCHGHWGR